MQLQNKTQKELRVHAITVHCKIPENMSEHVWRIFIANGEDLFNSYNICRFENAAVNIKDKKYKSTSEFITHFNTQNKEAFDDGVIEWLGQDVWWKISHQFIVMIVS